jgi:hypothetical protein
MRALDIAFHQVNGLKNIVEHQFAITRSQAGKIWRSKLLFENTHRRVHGPQWRIHLMRDAGHKLGKRAMLRELHFGAHALLGKLLFKTFLA